MPTEVIGNALIRPYTAGDRDAIRAICADTGFLGKPIDPIFEDRELFADYLTAYYTDAEPEAAFVIEVAGKVKGYLLGSRLPEAKKAWEKKKLPGLAARGLWRLFTRPYNAASRRYVWWILTQAGKEVPFTPPKMPHLHFNILPEAQGVKVSRSLIDHYLNFLVAKGEKAVYGQVVSFEGRRGAAVFARFGFKLADQREVTKYQHLHPGKIYLLTLVKDLTANPTMNGLDLNRVTNSGPAESASPL